MCDVLDRHSSNREWDDVGAGTHCNTHVHAIARELGADFAARVADTDNQNASSDERIRPPILDRVQHPPAIALEQCTAGNVGHVWIRDDAGRTDKCTRV